MKARISSALLLFVILFPSVSFAATDFNQLLGELEQQYQLPSGCLAKIARIESGGRNIVNAQTGNAAGIFQWTRASWNSVSRAVSGTRQPLADSERFNPSVAAKVTAVHARDNYNNLQGLIRQAGIDSCIGIYMGHFLGLGGARRFLSLYVQNPQANACREFPRECRSNAGLLGGNRTLASVIQEIGRRMGAGGSIQVVGNFEDRNGVSYSQTNADIAASSFLPISTPITPDTERTYPTSYLPTGLANPQQPSLPLIPTSAFANPSSVPPQTPTQQPPGKIPVATGISKNVPPASLIISQSSQILQGKTTLISWVSVGMKPDSCLITQDDFQFARGNEGSKMLTSELEGGGGGTITLVFECSPFSGINIRKSVNILVK